MSSRAASCLLLTVLACAPSPAPPEPPLAPTLEGDGALVFELHWTLRGSAPADTIVRLYLDDACQGPSWRDVTAEQLAAGVAIELVSGPPNVFTAVSIDLRGTSSACSAALHVSYQKPDRPRLQDVYITPQGPTRETHFVIRGAAADAASVKLFDSYCSGPPLGELSPEAFRDSGFAIDLQPNTTRTFVVQAINTLFETSACSSPLQAYSDRVPPVLSPQILSPRPSPEQSAIVRLSFYGDAAQGVAYLGPDCGGGQLATCAGYDCNAFRVPFPMAASSSWSVSAVDGVGNLSDCVNATDVWEWDPLAPPAEIELIANQQRLLGRVPASAQFVEIYDGWVCDPDHLRARLRGTQLAGQGYNTPGFNVPSDGGVLVARGFDTDMMPTSGCSQPVPWN